MRQRIFYACSIVAMALTISLVPSCAKNSDLGIDGTDSTPSQTLTQTATRQCVPKMGNVTAAGLNSFLNPSSSIADIEPPVTYCLSTGSSPTLRIEFEANAGVYYTSFGSTPPIYNATTTSGSTRMINIIFMDGYGLVQVVGSGNANSQVTAQVKFYNFPSYAQAEQDAINQAAQNCSNGTWTVAYCEGYGAPVPWWQQTQQNSVLSQAQAILNDSSKTSVLGTITY